MENKIKKEWTPRYLDQKYKLEEIIVLFNKGLPVYKIAKMVKLTIFSVYRYLRVAKLHGSGPKRDLVSGRYIRK